MIQAIIINELSEDAKPLERAQARARAVNAIASILSPFDVLQSIIWNEQQPNKQLIYHQMHERARAAQS